MTVYRIKTYRCKGPVIKTTLYYSWSTSILLRTRYRLNKINSEVFTKLRQKDSQNTQQFSDYLSTIKIATIDRIHFARYGHTYI